jgi:tRNA(Phe) wybutosine-synthesizing methylase Tyw3
MEKEIFCFSQVNPIKIGNLWIIPNHHQKAWIYAIYDAKKVEYQVLKCKDNGCILHASNANLKSKVLLQNFSKPCLLDKI